MTAGPCREPVDPVRYISNRSSGKMGYALATAAVALGGKVTLVSGPTSLSPPRAADFVAVETTDQMYRAVNRRFSRSDLLIMAAAPADFRSVRVARQKIKKNTADQILALKPTTDILLSLAAKKRSGQVVVGFAIETENGPANARRKLKEKNLDVVVLNDPTEAGAGFDHDTNRVTIIRPGRKAEVWPLMAKSEIAYKLLEKLSCML